ncbi:MAG: hypothetical protein JSV13_06765 [Nitrospiraceae bacterium]|nr:MAG: hypothetical protein JSV13_06765 [Nitrospiraceae bacterium]
MDTKELFEKSVLVMKQLFRKEEISDAIKRAYERGEGANHELLERERTAVNELVRLIADKHSSQNPLEGIPEMRKDALILRYFRNRDMFLKTFPDGIENVAGDLVSIWAALMISPLDEITS